MKTGAATLPLHGGKAPAWLFSRMRLMAREITLAIVSEYGPSEMLNRLSDPYWFQAFGSVLGFDWHSSGVTTTVCGALKDGLRGLEHESGLLIAGGKGGVSRKTPGEIEAAAEKGFLTVSPAPLVYASRMSAKVDSSGLQDGYQLYHHSFLCTQKGEWAVIQQGMNDENRKARRYHWLSKSVEHFVVEPHQAIASQAAGTQVLNMVAKESVSAQQVVTQLSQESPERTLKSLEKLKESFAKIQPTVEHSPAQQKLLSAPLPAQLSLFTQPQEERFATQQSYSRQPSQLAQQIPPGQQSVPLQSPRHVRLPEEDISGKKSNLPLECLSRQQIEENPLVRQSGSSCEGLPTQPIASSGCDSNTNSEQPTALKHLIMPARFAVELSDIQPENLKMIFLSTYDRQAEDFETLLGLPGVGPKTIRALTLIAELIYDTPAARNDPVLFSYAHGGKDGTPYPVDRETYDRNIEILRKAVAQAKLGKSEELAALKRLARAEMR